MQKNIYTISRFRSFPSDEHSSMNTVGFYFEKDEAIKAVEGNRCDLNEAGYYPYVMIEEFSQGIHGESWESILFQFNIKTRNYEKVDFKADITNYAMG